MLCAAQNSRMPEHNHYSTTPQSAKSRQAKRIKQDSTEIHWLLSPPPHKGAGPTGSSLSLHGITHWDAICKIVKVKPTFILQKTKRDSMCWWLLDYTGKWGRKQIKLCHFLYTHRKISTFISTNSPWLGTGGIVPWVKDPFPFKAPTWNAPLTVTESIGTGDGYQGSDSSWEENLCAFSILTGETQSSGLTEQNKGPDYEPKWSPPLENG